MVQCIALKKNMHPKKHNVTSVVNRSCGQTLSCDQMV